MQDMEESLETGMIPRPVCEAPDELQDPEYLEVYFDDVSGKELDSDGVRASRKAEVEFLEKIPVWKPVKREDLEPGTNMLNCRWVDTNKGDDQNPNYRSRYVAKEIKHGVHELLGGGVFCGHAAA